MEAKSSPQSGNPHDPLLLPEQFAFLPFGLDEAWKMGISTYQKIPKTTDKFPGFPHLSVSVKRCVTADFDNRTIRFREVGDARRNGEFIDIPTFQFLIMDGSNRQRTCSRSV
ncbi:MAG: hypothetical protein VB998_07725 [Pseudomonas sp.]